MKRITAICIMALVLIAACNNNPEQERQAKLADKKKELQKLKDEKAKTDDKIKALEVELAKLDTGMNKQQITKLVSLAPIQTETFSHYLELQGKVDAENISYITPRGMGGQVKALYVKKGDNVNKGQLLLKLDDAIARQNLATVKQSMGAVQTQLDLAKSVYERQQNLWNQHIGTEVQLLQAKSNMESLDNQLKTIRENVKSAEEQVRLTNVYSDVAGVADEVNIHVGETFTGAPMAGIKIVNTKNLKVVTDIPENYLSKVKQGAAVDILVPDVNKTIHSTISLVSQSISASSRGFIAESRIPYDPLLKPNQTAFVKILDYSSPTALTVPVNTLQTDEKGKYVLVASKEGDKMYARKRAVQIGESYKDKVEIKQGLQAGDQLITEGYQGLFDGAQIKTTNQ
jgi:membrane fusion protein, multidrug efflux system